MCAFLNKYYTRTKLQGKSLEQLEAPQVWNLMAMKAWFWFGSGQKGPGFDSDWNGYGPCFAAIWTTVSKGCRVNTVIFSFLCYQMIYLMFIYGPQGAMLIKCLILYCVHKLALLLTLTNFLCVPCFITIIIITVYILQVFTCVHCTLPHCTA